MRLNPVLLLLVVSASPLLAETPRVFPAGERPVDSRLCELRTLNSYFPFESVENGKQWEQRQEEIKRRILISQGLWPEPTKSKLNAVVHGRVGHDDYTVERVYFESVPGHFVTGSLYRPIGKTGPFPAVLCPHGHWRDARFYDAGETAARQSVANGAERFVNAGRNHIQARCVQLARMGVIAFFYDMTGNCDSIQIGHRPDKTDHLDTRENWGFISVQAELRLQNMMGLQTWNSVRSIDFLLDLPDVDATRIGVTGASGGGTQSMTIAAIDDRITAAMPCVMVSTSMQGGCTCENAPLMRIGQGNIDIAAAIAPRPLGLTAADDWTVELKTKGYPALLNLYSMLGHKNRLTAVFHTQFKHNYNHVNRAVMYGFFNRHFGLGFEEPVLERDFELLSKTQLSVWDEEHPAPAGTRVGDLHEIRLLATQTQDSEEQLTALIPESASDLKKFQDVVGKAWETILGRRLDQVGKLQFIDTKDVSRGEFLLTVGQLKHNAASEQIPAMRLKGAEGMQKGVVVWITETGKAGLLKNDEVIPSVAKLLKDGYLVVSADLSGQGEFLVNEQPLTSQRMWRQRDGKQTWHRFSGYTYGYNHSLIVKRVHDVLSLIKYASTLSAGKSVHLVGLGRAAGSIALAARSQAGDLVAATVVDLDGFQFHQVAKHHDPMFVSGSVKYLDVAGLLSVCSPHRVSVSGLENSLVAKKVFSAADASKNLTFVDRSDLKDITELLRSPN
ncbi:MAG: acetylxylan esterase [Planctomycetales bacterium]|jgi:dienelactone hydrolase